MRFDDPSHLARWVQSREFPAIHRPFVDFIVGHLSRAGAPVKILDLCCSYGLLGAQLAARMPGWKVFGIDRDIEAMGASVAERVPVLFLPPMAIRPPWYDLGDALDENRVQVLVARRCIPELLDGHPEPDRRTLADVLHRAGVRRIFLEGRAPVPRPKNHFHCVDREVEAFSGHYRLVARAGPCAYLEATE